MVDPLKEVPVLIIATAVTSALFGIDLYTSLAVFFSSVFAVLISPPCGFARSIIHCFFGVYFSAVVAGGINEYYPGLPDLLVGLSCGFSVTYFWRLIIDGLQEIGTTWKTSIIAWIKAWGNKNGS